MGGRQLAVGRGLGSLSKGEFWIFLGFLERVCRWGNQEVRERSGVTAKAHLVSLKICPKPAGGRCGHTIGIHL